MEYRFEIAEELYLNAFPPQERRSLESIRQLLEKDCFEFVPIFFDNDFKGFANLWFFKTFTYIEHFAIRQEERNRGYGTRFLQDLTTGCIHRYKDSKHWLNQWSKNFVLEVELPQNPAAIKRIAFYERLGFKVLEDYYFQPPYEKGGEGLEMKIMLLSLEKEKSPSFQEIRDTLYKYVYSVE